MFSSRNRVWNKLHFLTTSYHTLLAPNLTTIVQKCEKSTHPNIKLYCCLGCSMFGKEFETFWLRTYNFHSYYNHIIKARTICRYRIRRVSITSFFYAFHDIALNIKYLKIYLRFIIKDWTKFRIISNIILYTNLNLFAR